MKSVLLSLVVAGPLMGAWTFEDVPTALDPFGIYTVPIGAEFSAAYRAIHDANGVKTGENIGIAYRSMKLRFLIRTGNGWNHMTFADNGRYPSVALDSLGQTHVSFYETNLKKLLYAHPMTPGTGNCGPNVSWGCDQVPDTLVGSPIGRSALLITGSTVHILFETTGTTTGQQYVAYMAKPVGSPTWTVGPVQVTLGYGVKEITMRQDEAGGIHASVTDSTTTYWFRKQPGFWASVGPVGGAGVVAPTSGGAPRMCYRDYATNQLVYATSSGSTPWNLSIIDYGIGLMGNCAIAIPAANGIQPSWYYNPRIAYFDADSGLLNYATPPTISGGLWNVQNVVGTSISRKVELGLDRNGQPAIIYFDGALGKIRIARL